MAKDSRARPGQMLKRERQKLGKILRQAMVELNAEFTDWPRLVGGSFTVELTTRAGLLSVTWYGDWLACMFADPNLAARILPSGESRLNQCSGKWNFHFGRVCAAEALELFLTELKPILITAKVAGKE
jgi:hypothetical protein